MRNVTMVAAALLVLAVAAPPAAAQTTGPAYYASASATGVFPNCGTVAAPCKLIQDAVDVALVDAAVAPVIHVAVGTYNECVYTAYQPYQNQDGSTTQVQAKLIASDWTASGRNTSTIIVGSQCGPVPGTTDPQPTVTLGDGGSIQGFSIQGGVSSGVFVSGKADVLNNLITSNSSQTYVTTVLDSNGQPVQVTVDGTGGGIALNSNLSDTSFVAHLEGNTIAQNNADVFGGGIDILARADTADCTVFVKGNVIQGNTVGGNAGAPRDSAGVGGGINANTSAVFPHVAKIVIAGNTILSNNAKNQSDNSHFGIGGGIYASPLGPFLDNPGTTPSTETILITDQDPDPASGTTPVPIPNQIRSNIAGDSGGGVLAEILDGFNGAVFNVIVENNSITANTAVANGGGLFVQLRPTDIGFNTAVSTTMTVTARGNQITGNSTSIAPDPNDPSALFGGGGVYALFDAVRSAASDELALTVQGNDIRNNSTKTYGGGALLYSSANADPNLNGTVGATGTRFTFKNNLLAKNTAAGGAVPSLPGVGGGAYLYAQAQGGLATASVDMNFLTVASNNAESGAGGIELEDLMVPDFNNNLGQVQLRLRDSIIASNQGVGVGSASGTVDCSAATFGYNDTFGNVSGAYDGVFATCTSLGALTVDPQLDPVLYAPAVCNPTIDAADPTEPFAAERVPNGGRANMGHLGASAGAVFTLPDFNHDGTVDGLEVLQVALSFSSQVSDPAPSRYNLGVDVNFDGIIDGIDLAGIAATFGLSCP